MVLDADSLRIFDVNENLCSRLGYARGELLGLFVADIDPTFDEAEVRRSGMLTKEGLYRRKDGLMLPVEVNFSFAHLEKAYFVAVVRDITERKRAEQTLRRQQDQLRLLTAHLITSHDRERRQVAHALNEGTAQELSGVSLELGMLRQARDTSSALGIVAESQEALGRAMTQIRSVSNELHPQLLELAGLWTAISSYAKEFGRTHGLQVNVEFPVQTGRLSDAAEIGIFRVVQECLATIHEVSSAREVTIRVKQENERVILTISHSGNGHQGTVADWSAHEITLVHIVERARQFRGVVEINTANDSGAEVQLSIPAFFRRNETKEIRC